MTIGPIEIIVSGGTFGLPTNGHKKMWQKAARSATKLVITIASNPAKNPIFSVREIFEMISVVAQNIPNAEVRVAGNKYLVRFAKEIGATHVFRGIRDIKDLSEEQVARSVNKVIEPTIDTDYFLPDADQFEVSSSMVFSLVGFEGWEKVVAHYVHPFVLAKLIDWHYTRQHWKALWVALDAQDDETVMWNNIASRYGEPHRAYHNLAHITRSLREFDEVRHLLEDPLAVETAIFYHDIKHDPEARDNEEKSAKFARAALRKMGLDDKFGAKVGHLIMDASPNGTYADDDIKLLRDIDFSILGQPPDIFDKYEKGIREEYNHMEENDFKKRRTRKLWSFMGGDDGIFPTDHFRNRYEKQAEANIKRLIRQYEES